MPSHSLLRLTQKLYLTPHLINQQSFSNIEAYLSARNAGLVMPIPKDMPEDGMPPMKMDEVMGVGVIEVNGPLVNKADMFDALCGMCSYQSILEQCDEMLDAGCSTIVLCIDSGGGEAYGAFECADQLHKKCSDAGCSLICYVDGMAASAAYALAVSCDEIICNPFGEVGSIGVLVALMDQSKALEMEGLKPVYVSAGKEKIPFNADMSFKDSFLENLQTKVDALYGSFVDHVEKYTSMSAQQIRDTEAKTFMVEDAMELGMINKIMPMSEFVDYIASKQKGMSNA